MTGKELIEKIQESKAENKRIVVRSIKNKRVFGIASVYVDPLSPIEILIQDGDYIAVVDK